MTAKEKMVKKVKSLSVNQLKEIAVNMMERADDYAEIVFDFVLDELEIRMPEKQFCDFCESL